MVSDRLKTVIYNKLYSDLSCVEIIPHKDELWFIDRENKYWYFIYTSDGTLWWKYGFFNTFFGLFTLTDKEFTPILSSWVEEVLNRRVGTTTDANGNYEVMVEDVLNCKVNTTKRRTIPTKVQVKEFFYCKVNTTTASARLKSSLMEEIINHNVDNNCGSDLSYISEVNEVLNNTDI